MLSLVPLYVSATGSLRTRCFADGYWSSLCTRDGQPPDGGGSDAFHYALGECVAPSSITTGRSRCGAAEVTDFCARY